MPQYLLSKKGASHGAHNSNVTCDAGAAASVEAKVITTNQTNMENAPDWLTESRVQKVIDHIQAKLEWNIHKIPVKFYVSEEEFGRAQSMGPFAIAVTTTYEGKLTNGVNESSVVHLGPLVTNANFDEVFGHELVHVIVAQKYKSSIPKWFEEGLANHYANSTKVDYGWLASQTFPSDVRGLSHPMHGSLSEITYRYKASQAIAEMLEHAKKCDLENLIRISLTRNMDDYIKTYCEIPDLNAAFRTWVQSRGTKRV